MIADLHLAQFQQLGDVRGVQEGDVLEVENHVEVIALLDGLQQRGHVVREQRIVGQFDEQNVV